MTTAHSLFGSVMPRTSAATAVLAAAVMALGASGCGGKGESSKKPTPKAAAVKKADAAAASASVKDATVKAPSTVDAGGVSGAVKDAVTDTNKDSVADTAPSPEVVSASDAVDADVGPLKVADAAPSKVTADASGDLLAGKDVVAEPKDVGNVDSPAPPKPQPKKSVTKAAPKKPTTKAEPKPAPAKAEPTKPTTKAEPKPAPTKAEPKPAPAKAEPKPAPAKAEPKPPTPVAKTEPTPPPADPCKRKTFSTSLIKSACKRGQGAAKSAMRSFMKKAKKAGIKVSCKTCHSALGPNYPLTSDGLSKYREFAKKIKAAKGAAVTPRDTHSLAAWLRAR